jgi:predicted MFS family arabinose efflux permease
MINTLLTYFKSGPLRPLLTDPAAIREFYERKRWSIFLSLILGYAFFYTCRLGLSVTKKPLLDAGVLTASEMGIIGSVLLYVYAVGKFVNGVFADHANIRRFMSWALLLSAVVNIAFGYTNLFIGFVILWGLNGWFQSIGSAPSVVSLCQWFSNRERGTRYGIWAGAHNLGEGLTFVVVAWLVGHFGWRAGFVGPGLICVFVALTMFRTLGDRPQTYGLPHVADYTNDHSAGPPPTESTGALQKLVFRNPWVWLLALSCALMYVARYAINNWAILFLQEDQALLADRGRRRHGHLSSDGVHRRRGFGLDVGQILRLAPQFSHAHLRFAPDRWYDPALSGAARPPLARCGGDGHLRFRGRWTDRVSGRPDCRGHPAQGGRWHGQGADRHVRLCGGRHAGLDQRLAVGRA